MTDEGGSLSAFLAVLAVALFVLVGLVLDGGRILSAKRTAMDVAEQAARTGADQLSLDALRAGQFVVDPSAASTAVARYLAAAGQSGTVEISGSTVVVHVETTVHTVVLGIVGINKISVASSATATNVHGVTQEDQ
ncbi:MAG TPA: pilus assembly protein TadG-related protein [Acidimicrobiales bacterium]|nr:pilus assembly protein TadG-related protein [Acidimicrobiales bacterium]